MPEPLDAGYRQAPILAVSPRIGGSAEVVRWVEARLGLFGCVTDSHSGLRPT